MISIKWIPLISLHELKQIFFTLDSIVTKWIKHHYSHIVENIIFFTFHKNNIIHCNDNQTEHFVHHNASLVTKILISLQVVDFHLL